MDTLYLGVGRQIITPEIGSHLYGYRPGLISTSVNDELTATAFYFKQEDMAALLISVTLGGVNEDITDCIFESIYKKHGIPKEASLLNSIHTHSAPNVSGGYGWGEVDKKYRDEIFIPKTLLAVDEAISSAIPVEMAIASGESKIGINRRQLMLDNTVELGQNPWGAFNPKMTILSFRDLKGKSIANIIHYGAHATAAGANSEISRDWPGVMIDMLEEESGAVTAFVNGPEGDVGPRLSNGKTTGGGDIKYAMRHGAWAGRDAVNIYKNNMGTYHTPRLSTFGGTLEIPLSPRIPLEEARREYEKYRGKTVNYLGQMEKYYREVIESYNGGTDEASRSIKQNVIRLGDAAFVGFSYELFSEIGMRIDEASMIPHVLSLSNTTGVGGYFATESEICRGGYEIVMSRTNGVQPFVSNGDWYVVTGTLDNLEKTEE